MASPPSKSGHCCGIFVVTVMFMLGFSGHVTSDCAHPGTGHWFVPADGKVLTFTPGSLDGHAVSLATGTVTNSFGACSTSGDNNIYAATNVPTPGGEMDVYFCWKLVTKSANVMLLYELTVVDSTGVFPGDRVRYAWQGDPAPTATCSLNAADLHPKLLYKVASSSATDISVSSLDISKAECPASMQNIYSYVMGTDCQGTDSTLDVCQDTKAAQFNYTVCTDKPILFSNDGLLSCLASYTVSSTTYVLMGNHDATVSSPTTARFVCIKITSATTFDAYISDCSDMASATTKQLTVTVKETCSGTGGGTREGTGTGGGGGNSSSGGMDIVPIIAGAVAGLLLVAVLVAVVIVLKKKGKLGSKNRKSVAPSENGSVYAPTDGEVAKVDEVDLGKEES